MTTVPTSPTFPEGQRVQDTGTGRTYTATGQTAPNLGQLDYWALVTGDDGIVRQLPAGDLVPVDSPPAGFTPDIDSDGSYISHEGPDHQAGPVRVMRSWSPERGLCLWLDHPGKTGPSPVAELAELRDYLNAVIPAGGAL